MNQLSTQVAKLTRKRPLSSERTDTNTKKQRVQLPLVPNSDGDDFSASDDDDIQQQNNQSKSLDAILDSSEEDEALEEGEVSDEDMLADLQAAFQQTAETGPNIDQKIADVLNDDLRKTPSDETIKVLKDTSDLTISIIYKYPDQCSACTDEVTGCCNAENVRDVWLCHCTCN